MDAEILVEFFEADADAERLDVVARGVRRDLLELDVESVVPASAGEAPPGTRGIELAAVGALLVTVKGSVELVSKVVSVVKSWLGSSPAPDRSLRMTVDGRTLVLSDPTDAQQQQLVDEYVDWLSERR
ncbi:MAG: hypothetical protein ABJA81_01295 [Nocardioidaceae bacterium]